MEKEEERREKRGRKYNCMAAVYAEFPHCSLSCIFSWKMLQNYRKYSFFEGFAGKTRKWREKEEKKGDALYTAILINLLSLG